MSVYRTQAIDNLGYTLAIGTTGEAVEALESTAPMLQQIVDLSPGTPLADKVEDGLAKVQTVLEELAKDPPDTQAALGTLEGAVGDLAAAEDEGLGQGTALMDQLAGIARALAQIAIADAVAQGGEADKISDAQEALADGDALRAAFGFKDAVARYKDAVAKAEGAVS